MSFPTYSYLFPNFTTAAVPDEIPICRILIHVISMINNKCIFAIMNVQSSYLTGRTVWKLLQNNNKNYRSNTISMVDLFFRYIIKALSTAMTMSVFGFARIKLILTTIDSKEFET